MIPVEGHKGLFRDKTSNAIVNCNDYEYQEYLKLKSSAISERSEIDSLKNEIKELKLLMSKFLESKS